MKMHILGLLSVLCLVVQSLAGKGKHWGLLVAGAKEYDNYCIQASICHAYQILKAHGIPDERIVVMMYDDIAYNPSNPDKGKIINRPGGPNVYTGVPKDYIKENVTPEIFLKVLQGQKPGTGSGKIIDSGPDDNIFVNLVDHGMPGAFLFPSSYLMAHQLISALKNMHKKKRYNQMVIYMESCNSGSMFYKLLPKDINVFATTAANPRESSYMCYWVERLQVYVGAVYSCNWMENSDKRNLSVETLHKQYQIVKRETNTSHVQEYGDMKMGSDVLDDFQGISNGTGYVFDPFKLPPHLARAGIDRPLNFLTIKFQKTIQGVPITDAVPFEDVPLYVLERKIAATGRYSNDEILSFIEQRNALILRRKRNRAMMETIASLSGSNRIDAKEYYLNSHLDLTEHACYKAALDEINQICFNGHLTQDQFAGHEMHVLINMCEDRVPLDNMIAAMRRACLIGN